MILRLLIVILVFVLSYLSQRFWFKSLWRATERCVPWKRRVLRGLVVAALTLVILSFSERVVGRYWLPRVGVLQDVTALTQLWLFTSLFAFLLFGLVRLIETAWFKSKDLLTRTKPSGPADHNRRAFFRYAARTAAAIPLVAGIYGFASERFRFRVREVNVPLQDLPKGLDGLRIVQMSDIHAGDYMPIDELRRAVDMANNLRGHIAVITGDFVSNEHDPLDHCIAELSRLKAPLGIWGCNGNHEIYAKAEERSQALFQQHGMTLLRQENRQIEFNGAKFNLIGVDYQRDQMVAGPKMPMLYDANSLVRRDMPNILLSHNPNSFNRAAEMGIELSLAGHTHGGQVKFEILDKNITPARFITDFPAGLFDLPLSGSSVASNLKRSFLYVNRGLGTFALPARLGVEPEITLLTLRSV
ncbi:MAG TPA: metallophosphoesterase [Terriglobales bacterium]|nr:metallophosphoesterase [Terriglobales bacterium]